MRVFLLGCGCTIPAAVLELGIGQLIPEESLGETVAVNYLLIAPVEEFLKLAVVWIGIYRTEDFRDPMDGIVYAVTAALGFASVENLLYISFLGPKAVVYRILLITPAHVLFSAMWGASLGQARFQKNAEVTTISKGLGWAIVFHGTYNSISAMWSDAAMFAALPMLAGMAWIIERRMRFCRTDLPFAHLGEGPLIVCPTCGAYAAEQEGRCVRCDVPIPLVGNDLERYCPRCRAVLDPCRPTCSRCGEGVFLGGHLPRVCSAPCPETTCTVRDSPGGG
jgi:hypothetical protein